MRNLLFIAVILGASLPLSADLYFSEYIEGSEHNKALEIYNPFTMEVNLSEYSIQLYRNGKNEAEKSLSLSGLLQGGAVYVVANKKANKAILNVADLKTSSSVVNFNGDDTLTLLYQGKIIDVIGQIGVDPGANWGTDNVSTEGSTIRRKSSVMIGDEQPFDAFNPALEWDGFANNTFSGLGQF